MGLNEPKPLTQDVANLDPRGMVGMVYVGDHPTLLYTKYTSCGPHDYRKEDLKEKSHYKSMRAIDPQGRDKFASKRLHWQVLCRVPLDIAIHTKHVSCGPYGFREVFFHYKSMGVIDLHGLASLDPRCLIGRINAVEQ